MRRKYREEVSAARSHAVKSKHALKEIKRNPMENLRKELLFPGTVSKDERPKRERLRYLNK